MMSRTFVRGTLLAVAFTLGAGSLQGQQRPDSTAEERAYFARRAYLLRDGGVWWAENPNYAPGKAGQPSHFGYEFTEGYGPTTYRLKILGRLEDQKHVFWDGFCAWHPVRNALLYVSQGTGGAVASGMAINAAGHLAFEVIAPDGKVTQHLDTDSLRGPNEFESTSYRLEDGKWALNQRLLWKRDRGNG